MSEISNCDAVRRLLWPLDGPRGFVEGEEEARAHLEACDSCRAFFRRDALIGEVLQADRARTSTPPDVRERVFDALARERALTPTASVERPGIGRRLIRALPWAAAAVVVGILIGTFRNDDGLERLYAQDFLSRAVEEDVIESADPSEVSAFFMRELGVPVAPVTPPGVPVDRAMICLVGGERAAMVEYRFDGHTVAHYRMPRARAEAPRLATPSLSDEDGVCVYRWSDDRFEHALVSNLSEARLRAIAHDAFGAPAR